MAATLDAPWIDIHSGSAPVAPGAVAAAWYRQVQVPAYSVSCASRQSLPLPPGCTSYARRFAAVKTAVQTLWCRTRAPRRLALPSGVPSGNPEVHVSSCGWRDRGHKGARSAFATQPVTAPHSRDPVVSLARVGV